MGQSDSTCTGGKEEESGAAAQATRCVLLAWAETPCQAYNIMLTFYVGMQHNPIIQSYIRFCWNTVLTQLDGVSRENSIGGHHMSIQIK
jgi:hypothetical protein